MKYTMETPDWYRDWSERKNQGREARSRWLRVKQKRRDHGLAKDAQAAHDRVFARVDCLECAHCCRNLPALLTHADIDRISRHLQIRPGDFVEKFTAMDEDGDRILRGTPCPFLGNDNHCSIYDQRPRSCRQYPHTGNNQFVEQFDLHAQNVQWCPAVFHILEELMVKHPI